MCLANVVAASVLLWATLDQVSRPVGLVWCGVVGLVAILRLVVLRNVPAAPSAVKDWLFRYGLFVLASGLAWGASAWVLFAAGSILHQLLLVFVLGGLSSGSAATLGCYLPLYLLWVVPAFAPVTLRLASQADPIHAAMASTCTLYVLAMGLVARNTQQAFRSNVALRFEKQELLETLMSARSELELANSELDARVRAKTRELEDAERARERVERERRHAQKLEAIGRLTGGVAHDFNNLLTVVLNALPQVRGKIVADPRVEELLRDAQSSAQKGARLTNSLLAFSRSQLLRPVSVDVGPLLSEMRQHLLPPAIGQRVTVEVDCAEDLWPVLVDADQFRTAVLNLAVNAKDAMPGGGVFRLGAWNRKAGDAPSTLHGDAVELVFEDTGSGMSPEILEHAFEPFFTTKGVGEASGLGLSMVYGFARQSRGDARLTSEPGKGTRVTLWLPRSSEPVQAATPGPNCTSSSQRGNGEYILLVEDEPELRRVVSRLLTSLGYQVHHVPDGDHALAWLREGQHSVDLVLSDVMMPGKLDGFGLIRAARKLRPELPVLLVSGYPGAGDGPAADAIHEPGVLFVKKPFQPEDLASAVKRLLSARS